MALPAGAVEHYANWFFDVAERLDATDYIVHHAIGSPWGERVRDWYQLLPEYGYFGGPAVLDELIQAHREPDLALRSDLQVHLTCRLAVAIRMVALDDRVQAIKLLNLYKRIARALAEADLGLHRSGEEDVQMRKLQQALSELVESRRPCRLPDLKKIERLVVRFQPQSRAAA